MLRLAANNNFTHTIDLSALENHPSFAECLGLIMRSHMVFNAYAPQGEFKRHDPSQAAAQGELVKDIIRYATRHNQKPDDVINAVLTITLARGSEFAHKDDVDAFVASVRKCRASQRNRSIISYRWDD